MLWISQDLTVKQTDYEMMLCIGILGALQSLDSVTNWESERSDQDWTLIMQWLMPGFELILCQWIKSVNEDDLIPMQPKVIKALHYVCWVFG